MQNILFEWDERKNLTNIFPDTEHSTIEDRHILLGLSEIHKTLVVIHTEKDNKNDEQTIIRIISARKATKKEFLYYWIHRKQKEQV